MLRVVAGADAATGASHHFAGSPTGGGIAIARADVVVLDAALDLHETAPNGLDHTFRVTRPVIRRAPGGGWVVVSCSVDGQPLAWSAVGQKTTVDGITTELAAVVVVDGATFVLTETSIPLGPPRMLRVGPAALSRTDGTIVDATAAVVSDDPRPVGVWRYPGASKVAKVSVSFLEGTVEHIFRFPT